MPRDDAWINVQALSAALAKVYDALDDESGGGNGGNPQRRSPDLTVLAGLLTTQLRAGSYRFAPMRSLRLAKPDGGTRHLLVPAPLDRAVHGAAAHWLANALDPHFSDASHGYRPRLGVQTAAAAVTAHLAAHSGAWVLDADIQRCFDDIPHHCVISALSQHGLWNGKLAWVIKNCLHAEVHPACVTGGPYCIARGLPQGSPLSPVLANVVLDEFDRSLQRVGLAHVRYADDFVVVCQDQSAAQYARQHCAQSLQALGLRLSDEKTRILSADQGFDFLGRRFAIATATFSASTTTHPTTPPPIQRGASSIFRVLHVNADADPEGDANAIDWPKVPGRDEVADTSEFVVDVTTNADPAGDGDDGGNHVVKSNTYNGATADQPATEPLLRTLYLLEPRTTLERDGDSFRVVAPGQSVLPIPAARLHQIFCFGEVNLTSGAIALSLEQSVPIMLLGGRGRYYGVLDAIRNDNLDITRAQHRLLDDNAARLDIARAIVRGKMGNALALMRRVGRHRPALADLLPGFSQATADACNAVGAAETASQLMGIEGAQAAAYFTLWRSLLPEEWGFSGRKRQPPPDPINSLLSYGYTLLYYNVLTLVLARGLQPHLGVLHSPRSGHHALVSDLMEEFRAPVVDALVLDFVLNGKVKHDGFAWPEDAGGACLMAAHTRRRFIEAFERKLNGSNRSAQYVDGHRSGAVPGRHCRLDFRRRLDIQTLQLVSVLRGNALRYEPYRMVS